MKFFAVPFFGDMAGGVASLFSGSGDSSSTGWSRDQYRDYGDSAYRMHRQGYMDRNLTARMMGMGYASEFRGDLDNYYAGQGYDPAVLQEARFFGDEYRRSPGAYDGAYFNRLSSHHNTASYLAGGGGGMDSELLPYYDNHIRPGYARGGMGIGDGLLSGLNFGDGGGDMLNFLTGMGSRGFPSIGGIGGLGSMIPDCGFGGDDRGHGLGGLANLSNLGGIGRLFS